MVPGRGKLELTEGANGHDGSAGQVTHIVRSSPCKATLVLPMVAGNLPRGSIKARLSEATCIISERLQDAPWT
jgi:hypothetical protein